MANEDNKIIDILTSLSKRRGFVFQSSEIYGGLASTWDYGPLGVELKRNIKDLWWNHQNPQEKHNTLNEISKLLELHTGLLSHQIMDLMEI